MTMIPYFVNKFLRNLKMHSRFKDTKFLENRNNLLLISDNAFNRMIDAKKVNYFYIFNSFRLSNFTEKKF